MNSDHRKHKRFKTEGDIFAAFVMPNEPIIVGRILDLSHGGAGVQYLATTKLAYRADQYQDIRHELTSHGTNTVHSDL